MRANRNDGKKNRIKKVSVSTLISFILLLAVYSIIFQNDLETTKAQYVYIARNQAEHITTIVDCVMSRTNTLKAMIRENDGDISWFDKDASYLYKDVKDETDVSLKNFAIAPGGVVSKVYPLEGNEQLIGFDFLDESKEGNHEAKLAYEKGKTIITNPFELIQGGVGMGGRAPVILKNGEYWGLITVTIDFDNMMDVIGLNNLRGMGVDYSLSYIDDAGNANYLYGNTDLGKDAVKTRFAIRNLTWEIAVKPQKGWFAMWKVAIALIVILLLSAFAGIVTYMVIRLRESNALLRKLSITDALTGCLNRTAYAEKIIELSKTGLPEDFVYISVDLNGLKQANDQKGHAAGDELLSGATQCMQSGFEQYGTLYRIGGDEFAALICANEETLNEILNKVSSILDSWQGDLIDKVSVSIGYASHRQFPDLPIEELAKIADQKMYEAKRAYYQRHDRRKMR